MNVDTGPLVTTAMETFSSVIPYLYGVLGLFAGAFIVVMLVRLLMDKFL